MGAVRALALSALVTIAVAPGASAGPLDPGPSRWTVWSPSTGSPGQTYLLNSAAIPVSFASVPPVFSASPAPVTQPTATNDPSWSGSGAISSRWSTTPNADSTPSFGAAATIAATPSISTPSMPTFKASTPLAYDAAINMSSGGFAEANSLTIGGAQPWYLSPAARQVFNGTPNAQQQSEFTERVVGDVQQVFDRSQVPVRLTSDPNASAAHMLSVVSGTSYGPIPEAIGITDVGKNGFNFIDKFTGFAGDENQLAMALSHNISHELMHAFGIAVHHDESGHYIDSGFASASLLTDPTATFSPSTVSDLLSRDFSADSSFDGTTIHEGLGAQVGGLRIDGDQTINFQAVPEPSTIALWTVAAGCLALARARRIFRAA